MIKSFLIITILPILLYSSQQIILVVADDINTSRAKLECFEGSKLIFKAINVNIGRNGLAIGLGEKNFISNTNALKKYEGDGRAPLGIFKLTHIFGYTKNSHFSLPYLYASKDLICVDDSNSIFYNKIIKQQGDEKSFEYMKRDDEQYRIGIVVAHNKRNKDKRGSCIFLHVQKAEKSPTAGCTSMSYKDIQNISLWLDKTKEPILIQIPKKDKEKILQLYPELKKSTLLL